MKAQQRSTVVGVFRDRLHADQAISELRETGFRDDQIGVVMRHSEELARVLEREGGKETHAGSGALAGALTGLGLGALAGIGVLSGVIPVVGPAIAAGTLGVIMSNAAAGAGVAGLIGALIGAGIPEHEAKYYQEELEAGRTVVMVTANGRAKEAEAILHRYGAYDVDSRERSMIDETTPSTTAMNVPEEASYESPTPQMSDRPVRSEASETGGAIDVPVQVEEFVIERTPPLREENEEFGQRQDIHVPVREEHVKVSHEPVIADEYRMKKRMAQETEHVADNPRTQGKSGDFEKKGNEGTNPGPERPTGL